MISQEFHIILQRKPSDESAVTGETSFSPMGVTFEQAESALEQLPQLFFEPDGSFFWGAGQGDDRWGVSGTIYDRGPALDYVELNGRCTPEAFEDLLNAFGHQDAPLIIQLTRGGTYLSVEEFRSQLISEI